MQHSLQQSMKHLQYLVLPFYPPNTNAMAMAFPVVTPPALPV
jgi:hypothetical protein